MSDAPLNAGRRYLLGIATDEEAATIEQHLFEETDRADAIADEEDQLIEQYLAGTLSADERVRFEENYLSSPRHRRRVAVVQTLVNRSRRTADPSASFQWLAAAAVIFLTVGAVWRYAPPAAPHAPHEASATRQAAPAPATAREAPAATVFTFAIAAINVRSDAAPPPLVIPDGSDVVRLQLLREPSRAGEGATDSASIRTVAGRMVWTGAAAAGRRDDVLASLDVPAARLPPDDYIVECAGFRYYLPVRRQ